MKASGIAHYTAQLEKVDTALPVTPLVILNTMGYKPRTVAKIRDALRRAYRSGAGHEEGEGPALLSILIYLWNCGISEGVLPFASGPRQWLEHSAIVAADCGHCSASMEGVVNFGREGPAHCGS